ncbi:MAG: tRNA pseudouridine(65) synthase TruC [Bacteroidota bacterium]|jgi:tRNA pseudouridine65 synthase
MKTEGVESVEILWEDEDFMAVLKPANLIVHRSNFNFGEKDSLRDRLLDEGKGPVHPAHRLDKPTSGIVLFARHSQGARHLHQQFVSHSIAKKYLALVRGFTPDSGLIDKPLPGSDGGIPQPALTRYKKIAQTELEIPVGRYPTSRYSLLELHPETGRYHQLRLHMSHLRHPIIGDTRHGDIHHNRTFREVHLQPGLWLHATQLIFKNLSDKTIIIQHPPTHWKSGLAQLGFDLPW